MNNISDIAKRNLILATLIMTWTVIIYISFRGDPTNALHIHAQNFSFQLNAFTLTAYLFEKFLDIKVLS